MFQYQKCRAGSRACDSALPTHWSQQSSGHWSGSTHVERAGRAADRPLPDPAHVFPRAIRVSLPKSHVFRAIGRAAWRGQELLHRQRVGFVAPLEPLRSCGAACVVQPGGSKSPWQKQIVIDHVFRSLETIPQEALALVCQGPASRWGPGSHGQSIGVFDAQLSIEGEIFRSWPVGLRQNPPW